ncbi:hypothetical protein PF003_g2915 [Phytophthora fragariae]|nr:hypothetical protein PF003_g2915 [Phytophthora fragariae]
MRNAVYVKTRVYNKGTQGVPYEMFLARSLMCITDGSSEYCGL